MDRCTWVGIDKIYQDYHDTEWGVPEYDSRALWEKLILDGFQAGLSWITILKNARLSALLLRDLIPKKLQAGARLRWSYCCKTLALCVIAGKIEATIGNAQAYLHLAKEMPFSERMWAYVDGAPDCRWL